VDKAQGTPSAGGRAPSSTQNPLHESTEFYVQCAIKFVHEHENFRRKPLKGNGRGRIREEKERARLDILSRDLRVPSYATEENEGKG